MRCGMNNSGNKRKRILMLFLTLTLVALALAGCKKSGSPDEETEQKDYVYVPEYLQLDLGISSENMNVNSTVAYGDVLYMVVTSWDEEKGSESGLYKYNMVEGKTEKLPIEFGENDYINRLAVTGEGMLVALVNRTSYDLDENGEVSNYSSSMELMQIGDDGHEIGSLDISGVLSEEDSYVQYFTIDGQGNYYLYDGSQVLHVVTPELQKICDITTDNWINDMVVSKEGDVYITSYGENGLELKKVDLDTKSLGQKLEGVSSGYGNQSYYPAVTKSILVSGEQVGLYDVASATEEKLFSWLDVDVNNNYISQAGELSDGRIWALYQDYEASENKPELLVVKKVNASEVTPKEEITYGTLGLDWELKKLIIDFNKTNEKYRIVVKEYGAEDYQAGRTQFNADITTGNCPDLIDLTNGNYTLYANKGILEDLYPFMEKSGLKKEDYLENVLKAYEVDGKLYAVIPEFYVSTTMAKKSVVGDVDGWTLSEMLDFVEKSNPENVFEYGDRSGIFYYCIYYNIDEFIDWENGKCSFDGEDFIRTLEFAAKFSDGEEINWNESKGTYSKLKEDKILLLQGSVSSVQNYQMYKGMFDGEVAFVGYPNNERQGNLIQPSGGCVGISSKSGNKDGAWEFVQTIIGKEHQENMTDDWGFPVMVSALEKKFEADMTPEYYEDENGEQVESMKTSWGYNDFNIDIYAATQEEIDTVWALLKSANKISGSVDEQLINIITEETEPFFKGQKSAADTAAVIQNRIQIYVNENR